MSKDPRPAWFTYALGHNLEIYLTASLSLVLGVLGVFDLVDPRIVAGATLGTLALLAISAIGSRQQVDDLRAAVGSLATSVNDTIRADVPVDRFLAVKAPPLDDELRAADDIRLVGVTLSRTVRETLLRCRRPNGNDSLRRSSSTGRNRQR